MNKLLRTALGVALAMAVTACGDSLDDRVKQVAAHCPITINEVGFVRDIRLSGDTLIYDCTVTNSSIDIEALRKSAEEVRRVMALKIITIFDNNPELLKEITDNELTLSIRYKDRDGRELDIDYSGDELREARHASQRRDPEQRLRDEIAVSRASLPAKMTEGITITDVDDSEGMINFRCEVDEKLAGSDAMASLRLHGAEIREEMLASLRSGTEPDVMQLVEIAVSARRGIAYRYRGSESGDTMTICFTAGELRPGETKK